MFPRSIPETSKDLPSHMACHRHDIRIVENLVLADVVPGDYELIALPLKLQGLDAAPVRAVLTAACPPMRAWSPDAGLGYAGTGPTASEAPSPPG